MLISRPARAFCTSRRFTAARPPSPSRSRTAHHPAIAITTASTAPATARETASSRPSRFWHIHHERANAAPEIATVRLQRAIIRINRPPTEELDQRSVALMRGLYALLDPSTPTLRLGSAANTAQMLWRNPGANETRPECPPPYPPAGRSGGRNAIIALRRVRTMSSDQCGVYDPRARPRRAASQSP